jgi:hypothetical protein
MKRQHRCSCRLDSDPGHPIAVSIPEIAVPVTPGVRRRPRDHCRLSLRGMPLFRGAEAGDCRPRPKSPFALRKNEKYHLSRSERRFIPAPPTDNHRPPTTDYATRSGRFVHGPVRTIRRNDTTSVLYCSSPGRGVMLLFRLEGRRLQRPVLKSDLTSAHGHEWTGRGFGPRTAIDVQDPVVVGVQR